MTRSRTPGRVVTGLVAVVLMLFIGAAAWAVVDDYLQRGFLPRGATITGVPVGGLTRAEATRVIDEQVKGPLFAPITVTFRDAPTTVDPSGMMTSHRQSSQPASRSASFGASRARRTATTRPTSSRSTRPPFKNG